MLILLLQDIPKLGKKGEVKETADGYARNFLLAKKLAWPATPENINLLKRQAEKEKKEEEERQASLKKIAERLLGTIWEFKEKTDDQGRLFGGISSAHLAAALKQRGWPVEKHQIDLSKSIKQIGKYQVKIKLGQGIDSEIKVVVQGKG